MIRVASVLSLIPVFLAACSTIPAVTTDETVQGSPVAMSQQEVDLAVLRDLTIALIDVTQVYSQAAVLPEDASVREKQNAVLFADLARQHAGFAAESQTIISQLNGEPVSGGSAPGEGISSAIGHAQGDVLSLPSALEGEEMIISMLTEYLSDETISVDTKTFFQSLLPQVRASRDRIVATLTAWGGIGAAEAVDNDEDSVDADQP